MFIKFSYSNPFCTMESSKHVGTIKIGRSIIYFEGSESKILVILPIIVLAKGADPDKNQCHFQRNLIWFFTV